jgi:hypothetical protein
MKMTMGHDGEGGLSLNGQFVSALDGMLAFETKDGRAFPDNMNWEIAINPVTTLKEWHSKTENLLNGIRGQGYDLVFDPVIKYPDEALLNPDAYISGCNPDESAYTMDINTAPDFKVMDATRSCGDHVHVGVDGLDPYSFSRWMDLYVGIPLLFKEKPSNRREMYGKAGCLRVKDYGAEYRTLSNVWTGDKALREFVWEGTHKAVEASLKHDLFSIEDWHEIPTAIDTGDLALAQRVLDRLYILGVNRC